MCEYGPINLSGILNDMLCTCYLLQGRINNKNTHFPFSESIDFNTSNHKWVEFDFYKRLGYPLQCLIFVIGEQFFFLKKMLVSVTCFCYFEKKKIKKGYISSSIILSINLDLNRLYEVLLIPATKWWNVWHACGLLQRSLVVLAYDYIVLW